jgi:hypothetical protein
MNADPDADAEPAEYLDASAFKSRSIARPGWKGFREIRNLVIL